MNIYNFPPQLFHICYPVAYPDGQEEMLKWSFICPNQTIFDQVRATNIEKLSPSRPTWSVRSLLTRSHVRRPPTSLMGRSPSTLGPFVTSTLNIIFHLWLLGTMWYPLTRTIDWLHVCDCDFAKTLVFNYITVHLLEPI